MSGLSAPAASLALWDRAPASHTSSTVAFPLAPGIRAVFPVVHTPYEHYDSSFVSLS